MKRLFGGVLPLAASLSLMAASHPALAQADDPARTITVVCTFPAGTGAPAPIVGKFRNLLAKIQTEGITAWREYVKLAKIEPM